MRKEPFLIVYLTINLEGKRDFHYICSGKEQQKGTEPFPSPFL